jgi:hypothetical protein
LNNFFIFYSHLSGREKAYRLVVQVEVLVVDTVILGRVVEVRDFGDVKGVVLLVVEGLEQLAPPVIHHQHALAPIRRGRVLQQVSV